MLRRRVNGYAMAYLERWAKDRPPICMHGTLGDFWILGLLSRRRRACFEPAAFLPGKVGRGQIARSPSTSMTYLIEAR